VTRSLPSFDFRGDNSTEYKANKGYTTNNGNLVTYQHLYIPIRSNYFNQTEASRDANDSRDYHVASKALLNFHLTSILEIFITYLTYKSALSNNVGLFCVKVKFNLYD
jgi:hypothetical protein